MKQAFFLFGLLTVVGGVLGLIISRDSGYVIVRYDGWMIETSFWVFFASIAILFIFALMLTKLSSRFFSLPKNYESWKRKKRIDSSFRAAEQGILAMARSRWPEAKNLLIESSEHAERPLIFWILGAQAAHYFGSSGDRERLLRKISAQSSEAKEAVMYMRISFYIEEGRHREAVRSLLDIRANGVLTEFWLNRLVECYRALGEERKIEVLLPELKALSSVAD